MEDNVINTILLAILMLFFAVIVGMYQGSDDYKVQPLSEQVDNLFNKWRRIY